MSGSRILQQNVIRLQPTAALESTPLLGVRFSTSCTSGPLTQSFMHNMYVSAYII